MLNPVDLQEFKIRREIEQEMQSAQSNLVKENIGRCYICENFHKIPDNLPICNCPECSVTLGIKNSVRFQYIAMFCVGAVAATDNTQFVVSLQTGAQEIQRMNSALEDF